MDILEMKQEVSFDYVVKELINMYKKDDLILVRLITTNCHTRTFYQEDYYDEVYIVNYLFMNREKANKLLLKYNSDEENVIKIDINNFDPNLEETNQKLETIKEIISKCKFIINEKYEIPTNETLRKYKKQNFKNHKVDSIYLIGDFRRCFLHPNLVTKTNSFITNTSMNEDELLNITIKLFNKINKKYQTNLHKKLINLKNIREKIKQNSPLTNNEKKKLFILLNELEKEIQENSNIYEYTLRK